MRKLFILSILLLCIAPFAVAKIVWMAAWEIWVMDDDGSNRQRLTYNNIYDTKPRWSPNGKYIAFEREQPRETNEQNHDLFLMNIDGTQERKLTTYTGLDVNHEWSPDSQHLVFSSTRSDAWSVHIMDVETRDVRELTRVMEGHAAGSATWSPDGKRIAYVGKILEPFQSAIYIIGTDGKNPRPLFPPGVAQHYSPDWSPDGKHILYGESKSAGNLLLSDKIVIRTVDGRLVKEVEMPSIAKWLIQSACWIGTKHVLIDAIEDYTAPNGGQSDIYRYTLATDEIINLTNSPRDNDGFPDWIDDGALAVSLASKLAIRWGQLKKSH